MTLSVCHRILSLNCNWMDTWKTKVFSPCFCLDLIKHNPIYVCIHYNFKIKNEIFLKKPWLNHFIKTIYECFTYIRILSGVHIKRCLQSDQENLNDTRYICLVSEAICCSTIIHYNRTIYNTNRMNMTWNTCISYQETSDVNRDDETLSLLMRHCDLF